MVPWRTLARRTLFTRPPWLEVGDERIELPNGAEVEEFLWLRTRDYVAAVAITERQEVVMIRAYKHGPRKIALAVPAGYIEKDEEPLVAAKRELLEETGYAADDWSSLGSYVVDGNYGVATAHLYLARGARRVTEPASGDLEEMEIAVLPLADVSEHLRGGKITQLSSAAALAIAQGELRSRMD